MYEVKLSSHNWVLRRNLNERVLARLGTFSGVVLDLGCGRRLFEGDIRSQGCTYYGVDWTKSPHGVHGDVAADLSRAIPFADGVVDHALALEVLEHIPEPGIMLSEVHRVLRCGGTVTLSVPFQWWVHEAPWDYYRYTEHGLRYLFSKAGFSHIAVHAMSGFWTTWLVKFNYQTARLIRGPRFLRAALRCLLVPIWWTTQHLGSLADLAWREPRETVGYFVTATKE